MSRPRLILPLILLTYLFIGSLYAIQTPLWQIPDEPAHYNYIRHIVEQRTLPILQPGDYDAPYLERLKAERFPPGLPIDSVRYEAWQPPLYYLLAAPVFAATNGSLIAVRLFTLLLGSFVIVLTYLLGRALFPATVGLALTAAAFVAFVPQHIAMLAAANNDALAEVLITLGLLLVVRSISPESLESPESPTRTPTHALARRWLLIGLTLGLAFLTKLSAYPLAALFAAALLLVARRERWSARTLNRAAALAYLPALVIGGVWWARNLLVYGGLDFLAFARHDLVVQGQLRTSEALALWGTPTYLANFLQTTFQSWWGQFGWMGVVMDRRIYLGLLVYSIVVIVGCIGALASYRRTANGVNLSSPSGGGDRGGGELPRAFTLLAVQALLTVLVYLYYNLAFVQFQGRYLYPALPIVALAAAVALRQWARWLSGLLPQAARPLTETIVPIIPLVFQGLLALYALYAYILPQLAF